jgi:hypothetical protein
MIIEFLIVTQPSNIAILVKEREDVLCNTVKIVDLVRRTSTSETFDESNNNLQVRVYSRVYIEARHVRHSERTWETPPSAALRPP